MNPDLAATGTYTSGRVAVWFLLALAATYFWFSNPTSRFIAARHLHVPYSLHFGMPVLIGLSLGWVFGLFGRRVSWPQRAFIILMSVALPLIFLLFMLFMLYFGCGIWNAIAHNYMCGL